MPPERSPKPRRPAPTPRPRSRRPRQRRHHGGVARNRRDRARIARSGGKHGNRSPDDSSATALHSSSIGERRRSRRHRLRSGDWTVDGDDPAHGPAHPRSRGPAGSGRATPGLSAVSRKKIRAIPGSPGGLLWIFRALRTAKRKAPGATWHIGSNPARPRDVKNREGELEGDSNADMRFGCQCEAGFDSARIRHRRTSAGLTSRLEPPRRGGNNQPWRDTIE